MCSSDLDGNEDDVSAFKANLGETVSHDGIGHQRADNGAEGDNAGVDEKAGERRGVPGFDEIIEGPGLRNETGIGKQFGIRFQGCGKHPEQRDHDGDRSDRQNDRCENFGELTSAFATLVPGTRFWRGG